MASPCPHCGGHHQHTPPCNADGSRPYGVQLIEPSNAERHAWPDATEGYVAGLEENCDALADAGALALELLKTDRAELVSSACVLDPVTMAPRLETLSDETAGYLASHLDPVIAKLEAALALLEQA